ncbi:MAG: L,D-transpeptidase [Actinomycetia bacterium]|nr:L,D-transpeptidase [Actinomycetes bacterium]
MSSHRRRTSRRLVDRRRRRTTVERAARLGILLTAVVTTGAVGTIALQPDDGSADSRTVADDVDPPSSDWLGAGFDALHEGVHDARGANTGDNNGEADNTKADNANGKSKRDDTTASVEVPRHSGSGRRVVFDVSGQRVWIVGAGESVRSTYLVSGSRSDNLHPGRYEVFSRSRNAVGYGGHSTMEYFVRFARGKNSNIGFHDIPVNHAGKRIQSLDDLGTPQSAGCIRQKQPDAKRMWRFADNGTKVVVVA